MAADPLRLDGSFPDEMRAFWARPDDAPVVRPAPRPDPSYDWIIDQSGLPWLGILGGGAPMSIAAELSDEMAAEARAVETRAVLHRGDYGCGWRSLCLYGLDETSTRGSQHYGYPDESQAPYAWTDIARRCPATVAFLERNFAFERMNRIRFMVLDAGGYILPHRDLTTHCLAAVNIAITQPHGAYFKLRGAGYVPFQPASAFLIDIGSEHSCINMSDETRVHIIVHGQNPQKAFRDLVQRAYRASCAPTHEANAS